jgi:hypothetical protein
MISLGQSNGVLLQDAGMNLMHILELLEEFDAGRVVFGAGQHNYERGLPRSDDELAAFEKHAQLTLPDEYRAFVRQQWSSGAGPYYGLQALGEPSAELARPFDVNLTAEAPLVGAIRLADQGCGMTSVLVVSGAQRGQVWADRRDNGGPMTFEAPSFDAWFGEWIDRALIEAARPVLVGHVSMPGWEAHPFLDAAAQAIERYTADGRQLTPTDEQYPFYATDVLAYLRIYQRRFDDALAVFARIRDEQRDDFDALFDLARARLNRAAGNAQGWHDAACAGLAHENAWFSTRTSLLREAVDASFVLQRVDEALAHSEAIAKQTGEVQDYLMVAWHAVMTGDAERAAKWIVQTARDGVGCDESAPLASRVDELTQHGFLEALGNEVPDGAAALEAALQKHLSAASN